MSKSCIGLSKSSCSRNSRCQYVTKSRKYCRSIKNNTLKRKKLKQKELSKLRKDIYKLKIDLQKPNITPKRELSKLKEEVYKLKKGLYTPRKRRKNKPKKANTQKNKGILDNLFDSTTVKQKQKRKTLKTRKKTKSFFSDLF